MTKTMLLGYVKYIHLPLHLIYVNALPCET